MATTTTHYKLTKPATTDYVDIAILDANFDTIDGQMYTNASAISANVTNISSLTTRMTTAEGNIATNTADIATNVASLQGKADLKHVHSAADITSGILPLTRGGTGGGSAADALVSFGISATATELSYTANVTAPIQEQLNSKLPEAYTALDATKLTGLVPVASVPGASTTAIGGIEIATKTEAMALTDSSRAITPATLGNVLAGYVSTGILQAGQTTITYTASQETTAPITFSTAFASAPSVTVSAVATKPELVTLSVTSVTTTGFSIVANSTTADWGGVVEWIATARTQ